MSFGIFEYLGVQKNIVLLQRAADVKLVHSRLILQAAVPVFINQSLDSMEVSFDYCGDMNDIGHGFKFFKDKGLFMNQGSSCMESYDFAFEGSAPTPRSEKSSLPE